MIASYRWSLLGALSIAVGLGWPSLSAAQSQSNSLRVRSAPARAAEDVGDVDGASDVSESAAPTARSDERRAIGREPNGAGRGRRQEFDAPKTRSREAADDLKLPRVRPGEEPLIRRKRNADDGVIELEAANGAKASRLPRDDAGAAATGDAQGAPRSGPRAPFRLTAQQEARVDQILKRWEEESKKVKTLKCAFTKWEYDDTFAPGRHKTKVEGQLKFKAPDCGVFEEQKISEVWSEENKKYVPPSAAEESSLEHWVCDGKSVFQLDHHVKKLIQREIPAEMQGRAIVDGPLPFVFGAEAERLKSRYWIRERPDADDSKKLVTLEIWPKFQADAANYERVEIALTAKDFKPYGLKVHHPGGRSQSSYVLYQMSVNNVTWKILDDFAAPKTPRGWTREVVQADAPGPPSAPAGPSTPTRQAKRAGSATK